MAPSSDPTVYSAAILRVTPDVVPELRRAIEDTLEELSPHLQRMQDEAVLEEPWLGDSVSEKSYRVYNEVVMRDPNGPFHSLLLYEQQLRAISERLAQIQHNYDAAEAANSDLVARMT